MILHISPLWTIALICAVAVVIVLIIGIWMAFRVLKAAQGYIDQEAFDDWMDGEKWKQ